MTDWAGALTPTPATAPGPRGDVPRDGMFERAVAYVARMPSAIAGQGGHTATWAVARKCAADFGLTEAQTLEILRSYNARCEPPWSEKELAHKASDAVATARVSVPVEDRERHWTMPEQHYGRGNGHGEPPPDDEWCPSDDDDPRAPPKEKAEAPPAPKGKPLIEVMEAEQIFERVPPVAWTVQGLDLCPGAPAMLAGYGFGGKSIAAQSMALSIASGTLVWGSLAGVTGRVVHLDYEQGEYLTRRRYHRLLHGAELTPSDVQGRLALVCHPVIYLDDGRAETMLAALLDGATLCIIDSLRAAAPRIEENSSDARRVLDLLGRISEATGCAIVVIHHARKASQATTSIRETIRGSGALYDACSSVLVVEGDPDEDRRTVHHVKARMSGTLADPMSLRIDDTDGGGLVVAVERAPSQEEREHGRRIAHDDRFDGVVLDAVVAGPGRSTTELADSLHRNRSRDVSPALTRLRLAGLVRREDGPRHSDLWWPTGQEGSP